jgi:hypothetical protein
MRPVRDVSLWEDCREHSRLRNAKPDLGGPVEWWEQWHGLGLVCSARSLREGRLVALPCCGGLPCPTPFGVGKLETLIRGLCPLRVLAPGYYPESLRDSMGQGSAVLFVAGATIEAESMSESKRTLECGGSHAH